MPPVPGVTLDAMRESDVEHVARIEAVSFASAWQPEHFLHEILENRFAVNRVLRRGRSILGYSSVWHLDDELKINNFAIAAEQRRRGLGRWMLRHILTAAREAGCVHATLEVRDSNAAARGLYRAHGFVESGRRRGYYQREGEDAILMAAEL
ncbi:MAG: ribosomal protein S18-alanine N-acetyltransferase [bacterium]|nr:ribosomal protein S18-alanine N-acetyltransferase [bacterium]